MSYEERTCTVLTRKLTIISHAVSDMMNQPIDVNVSVAFQNHITLAKRALFRPIVANPPE
jgi:hypothetical protein